MKSKTLLLSFGIMTALMIIGLASAAITFSNVPTLSQTGNSFTITVQSNIDDTITFASTAVTNDGETITFSSPSNIVFLANTPQTIQVNYTKSSGFIFEEGITYTTNFTAVGSSSSTQSQLISFEVSDTPEEIQECSLIGNSGNDLDLEIDKFNVISGFGDDETWLPFATVQVEIDVENRNKDDEMEDITIGWGIYDLDEHEWILDDEEDDFNLDDGDDTTITIEFTLDDLNDYEDENDYIFYVWANAKLDDDNETELCSSDSDNVEIKIEDDFIILYDFQFLDTVSCGDQVDITAEIWNIGDDEQEDVTIEVHNSKLGISEIIQIGDIDEFDDLPFEYSFKIPSNIEEGKYDIYFTIYDEDEDVFENYDDDIAEFSIRLNVDGSCSSSSQEGVLVQAQLESETVVPGKDAIVKLTVQNTETSRQTYSVNIAGYTTWATLENQISPITLNAGESKDVLITFNVKEEISGEKTFNVEILNNNELILTQPVSVMIQSSSNTDSLEDFDWYLWGIVILNIILIVAIIIVAIKLARK